MASYFDDKGHIRPELVTNEAETAAKSFYEETNQSIKTNKNENSLKNSQLRKFYGEFKNYEAEIGYQDDAIEVRFAGVLPRIKMATAKVTYAKARKVVPETFVIWMKGHVSQINTLAEFQAFMLHFEAVVGFSYGIHGKD